MRDEGSHAGVNKEVWLGIGVAPPELVTSGIGPVVKVREAGVQTSYIFLKGERECLGAVYNKTVNIQYLKDY